jgi:hypothetical protein
MNALHVRHKKRKYRQCERGKCYSVTPELSYFAKLNSLDSCNKIAGVPQSVERHAKGSTVVVLESFLSSTASRPALVPPSILSSE